MLDSSPVSAPRQVLKETVNVAQTPITKLSWFLPTPPTGKSSTSTARRRKSTQVDATPTKRRKIEVADDSSDESDSEYEDDDLIDIDIPCRPRTDFHRPMYNQSNSAHRPLMHSTHSFAQNYACISYLLLQVRNPTP